MYKVIAFRAASVYELENKINTYLATHNINIITITMSDGGGSALILYKV